MQPVKSQDEGVFKPFGGILDPPLLVRIQTAQM